MTILEAFQLKTFNQVDDTEASKYLVFAGLNPTDDYDPENTEIKCKLFGVILEFLSQSNYGISQISEGGYSISYDVGLKGKALESISLESGCNRLIDLYGFKTRIINRSNLW